MVFQKSRKNLFSNLVGVPLFGVCSTTRLLYIPGSLFPREIFKVLLTSL